MANTREKVGKSDATLRENTDNSNNDFKNSKLIVSELTKSVKHIIQTEIDNILKGYKDQLERINFAVEMLQQHVSNLKRESSVLQDKLKVCRQ